MLFNEYILKQLATYAKIMFTARHTCKEEQCWFIDSLLRCIEMRNRPCVWFLYCVHEILSIKHMLKGQITVGVEDAKMWKSTSFSVCVRVLVVLSCFPSLGPQCCGVYVLDLSVWVSFKKSKETTVCCRAYVCVYLVQNWRWWRGCFATPWLIKQIYTDKRYIVMCNIKTQSTN